MAETKVKTDVDVLFDNIVFYVIVFLCVLLISSFGLIAEA
jgi:hypothetical protein